MNDPPYLENRHISEPATTVRPTRLGRNVGLGPLQSGYALPARHQPHVLILIVAEFSACLSRCKAPRSGILGRNIHCRYLLGAIDHWAFKSMHWPINLVFLGMKPRFPMRTLMMDWPRHLQHQIRRKGPWRWGSYRKFFRTKQL